MTNGKSISLVVICAVLKPMGAYLTPGHGSYMLSLA